MIFDLYKKLERIANPEQALRDFLSIVRKRLIEIKLNKIKN